MKMEEMQTFNGENGFVRLHEVVEAVLEVDPPTERREKHRVVLDLDGDEISGLVGPDSTFEAEADDGVLAIVVEPPIRRQVNEEHLS